MGVDSEYYLMIGIKSAYNTFRLYKSKSDSEYMSDEREVKYPIFKDYLPDGYTVLDDGMCCEYSVFGKVLCRSEYIDEIPNIEISPFILGGLVDDVYTWIKSFDIEVDKSDIRLISMVHFS